MQSENRNHDQALQLGTLSSTNSIRIGGVSPLRSFPYCSLTSRVLLENVSEPQEQDANYLASSSLDGVGFWLLALQHLSRLVSEPNDSTVLPSSQFFAVLGEIARQSSRSLCTCKMA